MKYNIVFYCKLAWLYIAHCTLHKSVWNGV